jgi:hypothetical protein
VHFPSCTSSHVSNPQWHYHINVCTVVILSFVRPLMLSVVLIWTAWSWDGWAETCLRYIAISWVFPAANAWLVLFFMIEWEVHSRHATFPAWEQHEWLNFLLCKHGHIWQITCSEQKFFLRSFNCHICLQSVPVWNTFCISIYMCRNPSSPLLLLCTLLCIHSTFNPFIPCFSVHLLHALLPAIGISFPCSWPQCFHVYKYKINCWSKSSLCPWALGVMNKWQIYQSASEVVAHVRQHLNVLHYVTQPVSL